jgi:hypothetical protein
MVLSETRAATRAWAKRAPRLRRRRRHGDAPGARLLIATSGFSVETYASAEQFLESPRSRTIACLVVDVHLGGVSGLDLHEGLVRSGSSIRRLHHRL